MIGLKAVWMQAHIASATPVEGPVFAVLADIFPFRSLDDDVVVLFEVLQRTGSDDHFGL